MILTVCAVVFGGWRDALGTQYYRNEQQDVLKTWKTKKRETYDALLAIGGNGSRGAISKDNSARFRVEHSRQRY